MNRTFSCASKDFSFHYAGHYAEGNGGTIVNVNVNNGKTTFQIVDDTKNTAIKVSQYMRKQNEQEKK